MTLSVENRASYHPSINDQSVFFSFNRRKVDKRLKIIVDNIRFTDKKVTDLGCSGGYFSFGLSPYAESILAVDGDEEIIGINQSVISSNPSKFNNVEFVKSDLTSDFIDGLESLNVVLLLSVFHHMLTASDAYGWNTEASKNDAFDVVKAIAKRADTFVFEIGRSNEGFDWSKSLPDMPSGEEAWVKENIYGDNFDIKVFKAPALSGFIGSVRESILKIENKKGILYRVLRKLLSVDPRDARNIYIGFRKH